MKIYLLEENGSDQLTALAQRFGLEHDASHALALVHTPQRLELRQRHKSNSGAVFVDFASASLQWRRQFGGGRSEALAKAVGIKRNYQPDVLDLTAGFGRDAFILAATGCRVHMIERHPVIAALLEDGLLRGYQDHSIGSWLRERLSLQYAQGEQLLAAQCTSSVQVVYLDPMFPHREKSALVKQPMQLLQSLVGMDDDAANLLAPARRLASKRVVVKRPACALPLANLAAHGHVLTKNHRFDIYMPLCPAS